MSSGSARRPALWRGGCCGAGGPSTGCARSMRCDRRGSSSARRSRAAPARRRRRITGRRERALPGFMGSSRPERSCGALRQPHAEGHLFPNHGHQPAAESLPEKCRERLVGSEGVIDQTAARFRFPLSGVVLTDVRQVFYHRRNAARGIADDSARAEDSLRAMTGHVQRQVFIARRDAACGDAARDARIETDADVTTLIEPHRKRLLDERVQAGDRHCAERSVELHVKARRVERRDEARGQATDVLNIRGGPKRHEIFGSRATSHMTHVDRGRIEAREGQYAGLRMPLALLAIDDFTPADEYGVYDHVSFEIGDPLLRCTPDWTPRVWWPAPVTQDVYVKRIDLHAPRAQSRAQRQAPTSSPRATTRPTFAFSSERRYGLARANTESLTGGATAIPRISTVESGRLAANPATRSAVAPLSVRATKFAAAISIVRLNKGRLVVPESAGSIAKSTMCHSRCSSSSRAICPRAHCTRRSSAACGKSIRATCTRGAYSGNRRPCWRTKNACRTAVGATPLSG